MSPEWRQQIGQLRRAGRELSIAGFGLPIGCIDPTIEETVGCIRLAFSA
jgi:hypothetical protein